MGRGNRGRSRGGGGGGSRRGNSGFRNSGGRGRGRFNSHNPMTKKDVSHLNQFGEQHPSEDQPEFELSSKKPRFEHNMSRGITTSYNRFRKGIADKNESESSESEEDITPYSELLSIFSGKKGKKEVQIISESEGESGSETTEDEKKSDSDENSDDADLALEDSNSSVTEAESEEENVKTVAKKKEIGKKSVSSGKDLKQQLDVVVHLDQEEIEPDILEENVIEDAEIDAELNQEASKSCVIDPFLLHYEREMNETLKEDLKSEKPYKSESQCEWPVLCRFQYIGLKKDEQQNQSNAMITCTPTINLSSIQKSLSVAIPETPLNPPRNVSLEALHVKSQLHSTLALTNQACIDKEACPDPLTPLQNEMFTLATQYHDLYFAQRTLDNAEDIRMVYCLHAANHIWKTRNRIVHHNAKLANKVEVPDEYRDQGFVRPKVLILVPFKDSALKIVKTLISLILVEEKGNVANKKRFVDEYGGLTLFLPKTNPKPDDYMATFGGNVDDNFKIGLAVTKKSIKLYTGFYASDIIVASPLGLRMIVGAEGEKNRDYDFLSSIEILIMDQADIFLMQNWDHVLHLIKHLHLQPKTTHGTDFSRIRPWALDGLAKYYCQTMIFSSIICPEHNALFSRHCRNFAGCAKLVGPVFKGSISQVTVQLPQVFQQFDCKSLQDVDDARFDYFIKKVLPNFTERLMSHTLIFVSSYFDFVRLRNHFKREEVSFVQICEYTKDKKLARARDLFFHNQKHFLVYTERAHFFRRFRLKGIGHIIFYQLPQYPHFYSELCNFIQEEFQNRRVRQRKNSSVNVMYCKYDALRLAAVVGSDRASYMLSSDKKVHAFVSGEF